MRGLHRAEEEGIGIGRGAAAAGDGSGVDLEDNRRGFQALQRAEGGGAVAGMRTVEEVSGFVEFFDQVEVRDDAAGLKR